MSVLQELIVKFNKNKNQELFIRIIKEIQNAEKIWQLRQLYRRNGQKGNLKKLNAVVSKFAPAVLSKDAAETAKMIHQLEATLNGER